MYVYVGFWIFNRTYVGTVVHVSLEGDSENIAYLPRYEETHANASASGT